MAQTQFVTSPAAPTQAKVVVCGDDRQNSGMREGNVSHAHVNAALREMRKTVLFGMQDRLRNGVLIEGDTILPRFPAGSPLLEFFYRGLKRLPRHLIRAILKKDISVTLVGGKGLLVFEDVTTFGRQEDRKEARESGEDLLVFHDVRNHQCFHIGFTRKTIYMPEGILREAINAGYNTWVISEMMIQESLPLLDYLLLLDFVKLAQRWLRTHYTMGSPDVVRKMLVAVNTHMVVPEGDDNTELDVLLRHYFSPMMALDKQIVGKDPQDVVDGFFDEPQERVWAEQKLKEIAGSHSFPTEFNLDRDMVHYVARRAAELKGLPIEPASVDEMLHDLADAARFRSARPKHSATLLDQLISAGLPGIIGFCKAVASETALEQAYITDTHLNYDAVEEFRKRLQALSGGPRYGMPESISSDFQGLLRYLVGRETDRQIQVFRDLPEWMQKRNLPYLRRMLIQVVRFATRERQELGDQLVDAIQGQSEVGPLLALADEYAPPDDEAEERRLTALVLKKLDQHPDFRTTIQRQIRTLEMAAETEEEAERSWVEALHELIPEDPHTHSSDAAGIRLCVRLYETQRNRNVDPQELVFHLACIFVRLDLNDQYPRMIEEIKTFGDEAVPALEFTLDSIPEDDEVCATIRSTARELLDTLT